MKKVMLLVLMLSLSLSGALCYAHGAAGTENEKGKDGTPMVFRATDEIVINPGFELQQGQEFELLIHPCPNYIREEETESNKHKTIHTQ